MLRKKEKTTFKVHRLIRGGFSGVFEHEGLGIYVSRKNGDSFLTPSRCEARCRKIAKLMGIELPKLKGGDDAN